MNAATPAPPPVVAKTPPSLKPLAPVSLNPGEKQVVKLELERHEHTGVFNVDVVVPEEAEGVTITKNPIAEGESSGDLEISIDEKVGDKQQDLTLTITATTVTDTNSEIATAQPLTRHGRRDGRS